MSKEEREKFFNELDQSQQGLYRIIKTEIEEWVENGRGDSEELAENILVMLVINNYKQGKR
jgi:hypothetical protein